MAEAKETEEYVKASDVRAMVNKAITERDKQHAEELASVRGSFPQAQVPANGGGPGVDKHRSSWNLAEQEAANRGEELPHWYDEKRPLVDPRSTAALNVDND